MRRANLVALALVVLIGAVTAALLMERIETERRERATPASPAAPTQTPAEPVAPPELDACYRLTYEQVVSPTSGVARTRCSLEHTTQTVDVDRLDLVADGHLLAVDSDRVQTQATTRCTDAVARHLGADDAGAESFRLSMLEAVWFTPTVAQARGGADWLRCDVVAVSHGERLIPLPPDTSGLLTDGRDEEFAMCGTAEPGAGGFSRVVCSTPHSWRAIASVDLPGTSYPSAARAGTTMEPLCREAAERAAADPLDFRWSEERPTIEQWEAGRRYGLCWVPTTQGSGAG